MAYSHSIYADIDTMIRDYQAIVDKRNTRNTTPSNLHNVGDQLVCPTCEQAVCTHFPETARYHYLR